MSSPDNVTQNPIMPLEHIAIAFSGGGFRAASFALGTFSYLDHLKIDGAPATNHIKYSSSASGGTITNILFGASRRKQESFTDFYKHAIQLLSGETTLKNALELLNDEAEWAPDKTTKQRNLINAFARVYDRDFFSQDVNGNKLTDEQSSMGIFWHHMENDEYEVCFNSTEFYRGKSFRFRTNGKPGPMGKAGNDSLYFDPDDLGPLKKIKLGDVLAASSCFPAGFEPIIYPGDFAHDRLKVEELSNGMIYKNYKLETQRLSNSIASEASDDDPKQKSYINHFSLMDGGITDNQGLMSMKDADIYRRENTQRPFDLMLVTDVASYFMDNFEPSEMDNDTPWLKKNADSYINSYQPWFRLFNPTQWISLILGLALILVTAFTPICLLARFISCGLGSCMLLLFTAITLLRSGKVTGMLIRNLGTFTFQKWFVSLVPLRQAFTPAIIKKLVDYLRETKLNVLELMLKNRLRSVMTMVLDVNLKQVRRLIFEIFFNDTRWENRRQANFIYDLSTHNTESREYRLRENYRKYHEQLWEKYGEHSEEVKDKEHEFERNLSLLLDDVNRMAFIAERARLVGTTLWFEGPEKENPTLRDVVQTGQFTTCANLLEYCLLLKAKEVPLEVNGRARLDQLLVQLTRDFIDFKSAPEWLWNKLDESINSNTPAT